MRLRPVNILNVKVWQTTLCKGAKGGIVSFMVLLQNWCQFKFPEYGQLFTVRAGRAWDVTVGGVGLGT